MEYNFRIYSTDNNRVYTMHQVTAGSITEAVNAVAGDIDASESIVSCTRYGVKDQAIITDPFLAALLLQEIDECFAHLIHTGYDTNRLAAVLSNYIDTDLDEYNVH